jgi:hypothetical protein
VAQRQKKVAKMPICNAQALLALPHDQMVEVIRRWNRKK